MNKHHKWYYMAMVMFYTQTYSMQNQSKKDSFSWKDAVNFFTPLGATVGSLGFYYNQKAPRNKFLGLFVTCCAAREVRNFTDSSAFNQMKWYFNSHRNTDAHQGTQRYQTKEQKPWGN